MTSSPAMDAAASLIAELIGHGVRDLVLSPGSRSQALALAAVRAANDGHLRLHVRIDERVAGFTALGLSGALPNPVAEWTLARIESSYLDPSRCPGCVRHMEERA